MPPVPRVELVGFERTNTFFLDTATPQAIEWGINWRAGLGVGVAGEIESTT